MASSIGAILTLGPRYETCFLSGRSLCSSETSPGLDLGGGPLCSSIVLGICWSLSIWRLTFVVSGKISGIVSLRISLFCFPCALSETLITWMPDLLNGSSHFLVSIFHLCDFLFSL